MTLESLGLTPSTLVFIVLGLTLVAFIWGRFRYDLVALAALLGSVMLGLVPADVFLPTFQQRSPGGGPAIPRVSSSWHRWQSACKSFRKKSRGSV